MTIPTAAALATLAALGASATLEAPLSPIPYWHWLDGPPVSHAIVLSASERYLRDGAAWCGCWYGKAQRRRMDFIMKKIQRDN